MLKPAFSCFRRLIPKSNARAVKRNAVSHFVAKLVKSFGGLRNAAESLDDFRY